MHSKTVHRSMGVVLPLLHVVGAGAVGNALAYLVANLGLYAGR
jgi:hypothetical protein